MKQPMMNDLPDRKKAEAVLETLKLVKDALANEYGEDFIQNNVAIILGCAMQGKSDDNFGLAANVMGNNMILEAAIAMSLTRLGDMYYKEAKLESLEEGIVMAITNCISNIVSNGEDMEVFKQSFSKILKKD